MHAWQTGVKTGTKYLWHNFLIDLSPHGRLHTCVVKKQEREREEGDTDTHNPLLLLLLHLPSFRTNCPHTLPSKLTVKYSLNSFYVDELSQTDKLPCCTTTTDTTVHMPAAASAQAQSCLAPVQPSPSPALPRLFRILVFLLLCLTMKACLAMYNCCCCCCWLLFPPPLLLPSPHRLHKAKQHHARPPLQQQ